MKTNLEVCELSLRSGVQMFQMFKGLSEHG